MLAYLEGRSTRISWACPVCQVPHVHYYNPPDITMRCAPHFTDEAAEIQRDFRASPRWSYWSFTTLWVSRIWVIVDLDKQSSSTGVVENESHIGWGWRENGSLGCKDWKCRQFSKTQKVSLSFFSLSVSPPTPFSLSVSLSPSLLFLSTLVCTCLYLCLHKFILLIIVPWDDCYDSWGSIRSALHSSGGPVPGPHPGVTWAFERQSIRPSSCHALFVFATLLKASQGHSADC